MTYTKHRPIRIDDELWKEFGDLVGDRNRSAIIRDLIRLCIGDVMNVIIEKTEVIKLDATMTRGEAKELLDALESICNDYDPECIKCAFAAGLKRSLKP